MGKQDWDLVVIGGGINGTGIARDAAGRGLKVLLCEQHDLAAHTSSASTKLIHGGLRYLEQGDIRLVRKALRERERLLHAAPHIIWPMRFVLPHGADLRPAWMLRVGLFLYDHLGGRGQLPRSHGIRLRHHPAGAALQARFKQGFEYSDCWVQDSRLVVLNARDAAERGACIRTRTIFADAVRRSRGWIVRLRDLRDGTESRVSARALVNAAGPWVNRVLDSLSLIRPAKRVRLVKGSHIVVPRLYEHAFAYTFQRPDRRVVFAIPYEGRYTLLGTTEEPFGGDPGAAAISDAEVAYLCDAANHHFRHPITSRDVAWQFSGVRPLFDDAAENASRVTRDYVLDLDADGRGAPMLTVFGGKLTTYRRLAEDALALLAKPLGFVDRPWTATVPLPGGDIPGADFDAFLDRFRRQHPWLPDPLAWRYARNYGTRSARLLGDANALEQLGPCLGGDLYEAELVYLRDQEWAESAEDVLWRRSRLGLHLDAGATAAVRRWFGEQGRSPAGGDRYPEQSAGM
ncbi:MAG: glycerol-3-phosphate dehydrogenase [Ectothiorhodospiraceae bacterium]|nr:glycerol-3-phosphate dehydrogenase [Ectothiorhodospiraceae bacterium]